MTQRRKSRYKRQPMANAPPNNVTPVHASLGQRYASAWSEINSRIQSRQTANLAFATTSLTAASYILGRFYEPGRVVPQKDIPLIVFSVGLVALSWVYVLWVRHNDAIIGLLSTFCKTIENLDNQKPQDKFPSWHDDKQGLIVKARDYRKLSDMATIGPAIISAAPALILACNMWQSALASSINMLIVAFAGVAACFFVYRNAGIRQRIASIELQNVNGVWKYSDPK